MTDKERRYLSYLLRLWQEWDRLPAVWRASLEDPHTGERFGFADIIQLFAFLEDRVSDETEPLALNPPDGRLAGPSGGAQIAPEQKVRSKDRIKRRLAK
jgi:hypothetical protein